MDQPSVKDVCTLEDLSDSTILSCLRQRCSGNNTYTSAGQVLLSVGHPLPPPQPSLPPSPSHLADYVVQLLLSEKEDQSIMLGGSHGAGKTPTNDLLMRSLFNMPTGNVLLWKRVSHASHALRALTQYRDGASGGLTVTSVWVDVGEKRVSGCEFSSLLLDCSDPCQYQIFQWLPSSLREGVPGASERLQSWRESLTGLGMEETMIEGLHTTLLAIQLLSGGGGEEPLQLSLLAEWLGVGEGDVIRLVQPPLSRLQSARVLYGYLVEWLVSWVNSVLAPSAANQCLRIAIVDPVGERRGAEGGTVDPVGERRGAEGGTLWDLVAGYVREMLHNVYCLRIFVWEQDQYQEEGVEWEAVEVDCNDKPVQALQELLHSLRGEGVEEVMAAVTTCCSRYPDICYLGESANSFVVAHHNGDRVYAVDERWCEGEREEEILAQLLAYSSQPLLQQLTQLLVLYSPDVLLGQPLPPSSLPERACLAVRVLYEWLTSSHPHFLLTLTPSHSPSGPFDQTLVLEQLQHLRVLDTALMQSCGFPLHIPIPSFVSQYSPLLLQSPHTHPTADTCVKILEEARLTGWQVGKTKVMLKAWHSDQLTAMKDLYTSSAVKLQQAFRRHFPGKGCGQRQNEQELLEEDIIRLRAYRYMLQCVNEECTSEGEEEKEEKEEKEEECEGEEEKEEECEGEEEKEEECEGEEEKEECEGEEEKEEECEREESEEEEEEEETDGVVPPTPPPRPVHTFSAPSLNLYHPHPTHPPYLRLLKTQENLIPSPPSTTCPLPPETRGQQAACRENPSVNSTTVTSKRPSWGKSKLPRETKAAPTTTPPTSEVWYHGKVRRDVAESRLRGSPFDCFLIRESENRAGGFSLSVRHQGCVKHFRIDHSLSSGRFALYGAQRSFPSLAALVEYHMQHCISTEGELLLRACPTEGSDLPPPLPPRRYLTSIRRPKDALPPLPPTLPRLPPTTTSLPVSNHICGTAPRPYSYHPTPPHSTRSHSLGVIPELSDEAVAILQRELEVEERIVEAARRLAELPSSSKKERQRRRQSLQQAQARLLSLRSQYHTVRERRMFLEQSMQHTTSPTNRRVSEPNPLPSPPRPPPRPRP